MRRLGLKTGERSFIRNVAIFMSGRSAASAITFLLTPVIARLYAPADFGMAAGFLAAVAVIGPLSCAGYDKAITVARSADDARRLFTLCVTMAIVAPVVVFPIVALLSVLGAIPRTLIGLGLLLWLLPVAIALEGITLASGAWLIRHGKYKMLASSEVVQTSVRSGTRVVAGLALGSTVGALLGSYVFALVAKLLVIRSAIAKAAPVDRVFLDKEQVGSLPAIARAYKDFPRYNMVTGFMMQMTAQLPVFVLGAAFGAHIVGFFAMADRVMRAPINITTNTLRQVVLQKLSEIWNTNRPIRRQLTRTLLVLMALGIVPFFIFWTSGEELFAFVLGDRWRTAGNYIQIMVPYFAVAFLGAPFQAATTAMRRQRLWFWLELCTAMSRLAIIPVAMSPGATPELVLRVYVWTTVSTKLLSFAIVYSRVPRVHPGFGNA
jgi:O-antigen/teichoic acid export membrane protein